LIYLKGKNYKPIQCDVFLTQDFLKVIFTLAVTLSLAAIVTSEVQKMKKEKKKSSFGSRVPHLK